jgi:hypothetical protein
MSDYEELHSELAVIKRRCEHYRLEAIRLKHEAMEREKHIKELHARRERELAALKTSQLERITLLEAMAAASEERIVLMQSQLVQRTNEWTFARRSLAGCERDLAVVKELNRRILARWAGKK